MAHTPDDPPLFSTFGWATVITVALWVAGVIAWTHLMGH